MTIRSRLILSTLLILSLAVPGMARKASMEQSVRPLQTPSDSGQLVSFCTAFSISEKEGLWATARHCAVFAEEMQLTVSIGGSWAIVVYESPTDDMALFQSGTKAPVLTLSGQEPQVGDPITIEGFPYGLFRLIESKGHMAARQEPTDNGVSDVLDIAVAPGSSGSPVLNKDGNVIGILWGKFDKSDHALSVPWEAVRRSLGVYFDRVYE